MARLGPGAFIGEVALMTDQPRSATVTAVAGGEQPADRSRDVVARARRRTARCSRAVLRFVRDRLVDRWTRTSPLFRPFDGRPRRAASLRFPRDRRGRMLLRPAGAPKASASCSPGTSRSAAAAPPRDARPRRSRRRDRAALGTSFKSDVVARARARALSARERVPRDDHDAPALLEYIGEQAEHSRQLHIL